MSINLIAFLEDFKPVNEVQRLLRGIVLLHVKLDEYAEEDLFLQTSKELQINLLKLEKKKYAKLVEIINESSLEEHTKRLEQIRAEIKKFTSEYEMNSITGQQINVLNRQLETVNTFMIVKDRYDTLKPLDELIQDEKALMKVFSEKLPSTPSI